MVAKRSRKARAGAEPAGFDSSTFLHFHARVADGEANGLQSRDSRFESVPWCHRRARQMVSQHTANVPSVHARLGSIPRLSAKLVSKKVRVSGGYGWPRLPVEQSAPSERPGSNPGTSTTLRRIGHRRNLPPLDSKAVQVFSQSIGIVRGQFTTA